MVIPGTDAWRRLGQRARAMPVADAVRAGPWLILAPHPDDESIGAGALIATLAAAGQPPAVAFLTDGAASHVGAPGWPRGRVAAARAGEARRALLALGCAGAPLRLGWADAAPHAAGTPGFEVSARRLTHACRRRGARALATTWGGDPHCDHEAAAALGRTVARRLGIGFYEYVVWGWTLPEPRLERRRAVRVPVARGRAAARRAIACHRSQIGGRIIGAGDAFRLPRAMMRLADRPALLLLKDDRDAP